MTIAPNPRDGYLDGVLYRPLSHHLTRALLPTPITPNVVTVVGIGFGIAGGLSLARPGPGWLALAVGCLFVSGVLDCSDGELARLRQAESRLGHWLDIGGDTLVHAGVLGGIALRLGREGLVPGWPVLLVLASGVLGAFAAITWSEHVEDTRRRAAAWENRVLDRVLGPLATRDWYVFPVLLALAGRLAWLVPAAAVGAHVFWVLVVILVRRALAWSALVAAPDERTSRLRQQVYGFAALGHFPPRRRLLIRLAGVAFHWLIALIGRTVRFTVEGEHHFDDIHRRGHGVIGAFWHNRVFLSTWFWRRRGIVVMTSQSFDGEYIARFIQRFGYGAARGSATRGGSRAFVQMRACVRAGMDVAFTIDGPRGPRYEAKPGAIWLARAAGGEVLPMAVASERFWEVPSWDRFQIPKPFTRAVMVLGEPIAVAPDADDAEIAARQAELQRALERLTVRADAWWAARTPPAPRA